MQSQSRQAAALNLGIVEGLFKSRKQQCLRLFLIAGKMPGLRACLMVDEGMVNDYHKDKMEQGVLRGAGRLVEGGTTDD